MEKRNKIPMVYGYAICLVAVITFIISISTLVNAVIDFGDPIHAGSGRYNGPSLASFENYKMDVLKSAEKELAYVPDDQTLQSMYKAAKDDRIQSALHNTRRSIIVNSLLIIICVVLFVTHWRWMRKQPK